MAICFGLFSCVPDDDSAPAQRQGAASQDNSETNKNVTANPTPDANAYLKPGPVGDGSFILPNGRMVKPAGSFVETPTFPLDVVVSPDGNTAVIAVGWSSGEIWIYDVPTGQITYEFNDVAGTFQGIVFNGAGDRFWVSGGFDHAIYEFDLVAGTPVMQRRIATTGFPSGLVLSADEQFLYTAFHMNKQMAKIKIANGNVVKSYPAHLYPYDVAILANETRGFVSNLGANSVTAFNLATTAVLAEIPVGKNPEGLAMSPDDAYLYVANSDSDSITVIDTESLEVTATWDLHDDDILAMGAMPLAIEVTPDGSKLYVTCAGYDSIDVIDTDDGSILGRIPTGWYPNNAYLDSANDRLFVVNGKGVGSAGTTHGVRWPGNLQVVDLPASQAELDLLTEDTEDGLRWAQNFYADWNDTFESPIPREFGARSEQIKHVVFILKENKTYDQVLGDLEFGEADPQYCIFGEEITPNQHALARKFTNCDNFYVEGDTSVIGHLWATFANCNDLAEKAFLSGGKYPLPDVDPATRPKAGPIFGRILDAGLEFRAYGQIVGFTGDLDRYAPYMDLHYGFWNMGTLDETQKAEEIIREWNKGLFPDFIYIVLPNDHNYGSSAGAPTPEFLMGDNDAGVGKLVDWISHSQYWNETAIFVTEDDPQAGWDHIDPHRTISLVISPWAKRDYNSSVLYSQSSIWLTIEMILGLTPSSKYDQYAAPMYDCFNMEPDLAPYNYVTNPVEFELNQKGLPFGDYCDHANFLVPDGVPGMARVLWAMYKPGIPFPNSDSVDQDIESLEEPAEEDEKEDVEFYVKSVNQARAWASLRGITIPVPEGWEQLTRQIQKAEQSKN